MHWYPKGYCAFSVLKMLVTPVFCCYIHSVNLQHPNISLHLLHIILFTFFRCCQEEFVQLLRVSLVSNHFLYSHGLNAWFGGRKRSVKKCEENSMLVPLRGSRVNKLLWHITRTQGYIAVREENYKTITSLWFKSRHSFFETNLLLHYTYLWL